MASPPPSPSAPRRADRHHAAAGLTAAGSAHLAADAAAGQPGAERSGARHLVFSTPEDIDCHNGNFQNFSASWTTQHAVKTTISIDGPGVYKTYGPDDSDSLPFNCSSAHSFTLTAYGSDGRTVSQTITLQPRNVQSQGNGDPDQ